MFIAMGARPDISHAISILSRFNSRPTSTHLTVAKRVLHYLKTTRHLCLSYKSRGKDEIVGYTDLDWAGSLNNRKSTGGYVFTFNGTAISWQSKKQTVCARSTLEAEYMAASNAIPEAIWLQHLNDKINLSIRHAQPTDEPVPTQMECDNMGALKLIHTGTIATQTRHIDVKYHHVMVSKRKKIMEFSHIPTMENVADLFKKALSPK
jgi:hypothetical protein